MSDRPLRLCAAVFTAVLLTIAGPTPLAAQPANGPDYVFGSATAEAVLSATTLASMALTLEKSSSTVFARPMASG